MASAISFSGIASGIDSSALIKSLLDQERNVKIFPLQDQISGLTSTNEAFGKLNALLETLKTNSALFRTINGGGVSKVGSSSDDGVVTSATTNAASSGSYSLNVTQLAKNATFSFGSSTGNYTSTSAKISAGAAFSDSVVVKIGATASPIDTVTVNINENTSLSDFVTEFNSQTSDASAALVNVGTTAIPNYRVVINSNKTGLESGEIDVTVGAGITARSAFDLNIEDDAKDAIFNIAGVATGIVRSSNSITDVITGVTLNLQDTGSAVLRIGLDTNKSSSAMKDFIESYNAVTAFIKENDLVTQEQNGSDLKSIFGPFSKTSIDENIITALRSALTGSSTSGGLVNSLADLGVTTQRDGSLAFDKAIFNQSLSSDPSSVENILTKLGETLAATNGTIAQFTRFNGIIDSSESSNTATISNLNKRVGEIESNLSRYEDSLMKRFSALEVISGKLQSAQAALAGLPGA